MSAAVLHVVAAVTAIVLLVFLSRTVLAGGPAPVRSALMRGAVLAVLVLPIARAAFPVWTVPGWTRTEVRPVLPAEAGEANEAAGGTAVAAGAGPVMVFGQRDPGAAGEDRRASAWTWAVLLWAAGALLVLVRHGTGALAVRRTLRCAQEIDAAPTLIMAASAGAAAGFRGRVRLYRSEEVAGPAACGLLRPSVLLPVGYESWPEKTLRSVLCHELAHLRRRDPIFLSAGVLARALYWPHPGVWWLVRGMAREAEHACDEAVVSAGFDPVRYASDLVRLARKSVGFERLPAPLVPMAAGALERRVKRLLGRRVVASERHGLSAVVLIAPMVLGTAIGTARETVDLTTAQSRLTPGSTRIQGPLETSWTRGNRRHDAEVLGSFTVLPGGRLIPASPDALLRVWVRRPDRPDRLYVAAAAEGGVRLEIGWTGAAGAAPNGDELEAFNREIVPDLVRASAAHPRVDTVMEARREVTMAMLSAAPGTGVVARDRDAFTALVHTALTRALPAHLAGRRQLLDDVALELWTELHITILWPAADGGRHPTIGIEGNADLTVIHGQSADLVAEVATRGGPLSRRLPEVLARRFGAAGMTLPPALLADMEPVGSAIAAAWEDHYQRKREDR